MKSTGFYTPVKIFNIKTAENKGKTFCLVSYILLNLGIACLAMDRYGSSLYAAVTDKNVYEFSLASDQTTPSNVFWLDIILKFFSGHIYSGARINPMFDVAQV